MNLKISLEIIQFNLYRNELKKLSDEKLIIIQDDNIRLSNKGIDLANLVWEEFV